ncbi:MAG: MFS transporter [Spirochaetota bacterium]
MSKYIARWKSADINLRFFLIGILFLGVNGGILTTSFNNYLNDLFPMDASQRGMLEFPRELPGFILIAVTGLLAAFSMRSWAVLVCIFSFAGVFGLGFFSPSVYLMMGWMLLWSMGDHLFMPVESTMGIYFAHEGKQGRRLGQISGARNLAMIAGAVGVYLLASYFSGEKLYRWLYAAGALCAILAVGAFSKIKLPAGHHADNRKFVFRKEYSYFYILNILFGARKQIFLTFAPWALITVFGTKPDTMAVLIMIASIAGVLFRQVFGIFVDRFGERNMFIADAVILFAICMGFAFSRNVNFLYFLFIFDNLMFATRIARTTYLSKISRHKNEIPATLSLGITMDHAVSMTIPFAGGLLWNSFGYASVFIAASVIAFAVLVTALQVGKNPLLSGK